MSSRSTFLPCLVPLHAISEDSGTPASLFRGRGFRMLHIQAGSPCSSVRNGFLPDEHAVFWMNERMEDAGL